jgi:hypothetical protein
MERKVNFTKAGFRLVNASGTVVVGRARLTNDGKVEVQLEASAAVDGEPEFTVVDRGQQVTLVYRLEGPS